MLDRHEIPTHLGVQDRFFYGLTMAQLALLLLGGSSAWAAWSDWQALPPVPRAAAAVAIMLLTLAVALVRPGGRGLPTWALVILRYTGTPKRSVWRPRAPARDTATAAGSGWAPLSPGVAWAPVEGRQ